MTDAHPADPHPVVGADVRRARVRELQVVQIRAVRRAEGDPPDDAVVPVPDLVDAVAAARADVEREMRPAAIGDRLEVVDPFAARQVPEDPPAGETIIAAFWPAGGRGICRGVTSRLPAAAALAPVSRPETHSGDGRKLGSVR